MKRRVFLTGAASAALLTGCQSSSTNSKPKPGGFRSRLQKLFKRRDTGDKQARLARPEPFKKGGPTPETLASYGQVTDGEFTIPAVPIDKIEKQFLRQRVDYVTSERVGTVVVDVPKRMLFVVEKGGTAMRYGVGVGKQGFEWQGDAKMQWKRHWPTWTPPAEMIERRPELEKYSEENGGMEPGLDNPLGARALYLFQGGKDTLYRLHGTPEWWSIGKNVSSGCIRLMNQDVIDLYDRVRNGAKVVVMQSGSSTA